MLNEDRQRELDRLLDGDLAENERASMQESLASDPEALEWLADRALMHASLRRAMQRRATENEALPVRQAPLLSVPGIKPPRTLMALAAILVFVLTLLFWPRSPMDLTFATMQQTQSAFWESSEWPTANGSRFGTGNASPCGGSGHASI